MYSLSHFYQQVLLDIFIVLINSGKAQTYDPRPTVNIAQGTVVGVKVYPDVSRVAINAFLGIPYAEPPEGRLRFAIPERHRGWNGTLYASNYGPVCPFRTMSYGTHEKEDCLYLNIWSPEDAFGQKLPVIVYLESKQMAGSHPTLIRMPGYDLATEGVVVVSVSYRQNIFGFFCLGSPEARGNLGLLDQYLALLWIKENISKFGGNPQIVTLMGHSSSAIAIMYHMISPRTTGLFNKAIIMSGSATAPWNSKDPVTISNKLIANLGCSLSTVHASLECLRAKTFQEILREFDRQTEDIWYGSVMPITDTFLPEKDRYLPQSLEAALQSGNYTAIAILTGITDFLSNAEQWKWADLNHDVNQLTQYAEESLIPSLIQHYGFDGPNKNAITDIIRWKYLWSDQRDARRLAGQIHKLQWDARVAAPHDHQLRLLSNSSRASIYAYCLHQLTSLANVSTASTIGGDLLLLFGPALVQQVARRRFTTVEAALSKHLKVLWTTFAKRGYPVTDLDQEIWQLYSNSNRHVQYFDSKEWSPAAYESGVNLWNKLLPKLAAATSPVNTIPKELQYSPDPAAGFRHAMYTLVGLVVALLALLLVCVVLLKRRAKERTRHMGF